MKKINHFFWWCAGARTEILDSYPTEQSKYFGIGGTIIFTALMAAFAGGYAFNTAFHNIYLAIPFGVFWGSLIFNLDRYIVSTIGKGDGTTKITKEEWIMASPRLIMAIVLGFVIATPLELKLFESEINVEVGNIVNEERSKLSNGETPILNLIADKRNEIEKLKAEPEKESEKVIKDNSSESNYYLQKKAILEKELNALNIVIATEQKQWNMWNSLYLKVQEDPDQTALAQSRLAERNRHSNFQNLKTKADLNSKITSLENEKVEELKTGYDGVNSLKQHNQPRIDALNKQISNLEETLIDKRTANDDLAKQYSGLMARLEALSRLSSKYLIMQLARILITLLFIFIEVAPVLFKMMSESGPYDDVIERIKHEVYITEKLKISNLNDEVNTDLEISTNKNKNRMDAELLGNSELLNEIASKQAALAKVAIDKWYQDELIKLTADPEYNYTQSSVPSSNGV